MIDLSGTLWSGVLYRGLDKQVQELVPSYGILRTLDVDYMGEHLGPLLVHTDQSIKLHALLQLKMLQGMIVLASPEVKAAQSHSQRKAECILEFWWSGSFASLPWMLFRLATDQACSHSQNRWLDGCSVCAIVHTHATVLWGIVIIGGIVLAYYAVAASARAMSDRAPTNPVCLCHLSFILLSFVAKNAFLTNWMQAARYVVSWAQWSNSSDFFLVGVKKLSLPAYPMAFKIADCESAPYTAGYGTQAAFDHFCCRVCEVWQ